MIKLARIVEQSGTEGQYYDLGKDFSTFRRTIDSAGEQLKHKFERIIGSKLVGKRIRARASRGYKQYVKDYEFDVSKITLDDYYDNYVVVAHDNTTPKAKEYFLKPGFKIQILGPITGQPSPQKGDKPSDTSHPVSPEHPKLQQQQQQQPISPLGNTSSEEPIKEEHISGLYDAYPIDAIAKDIKSWIPSILIKPETILRDFIKGLGWQKDLGRGTSVSMFDLKIPADSVKKEIGVDQVKNMVRQSGNHGGTIDTKFDIVKMEPDDVKGIWNIRIKKTMTDKSV